MDDRLTDKGRDWLEPVDEAVSLSALCVHEGWLTAESQK